MSRHLTGAAAAVALVASALGAQQSPSAPIRPAAQEPVGALRGVVFDSTAAAPLVGATVHVVPQADPAAAGVLVETDSLGEYRIPRLAAGRYYIGVRHPRLDSLGLELPIHLAEVQGGGAWALVDVATPGPGTTAAARCGGLAQGAGALFGRVLDADGGAPVADGSVVVRWTELVVDTRRGVRRELRSVRAPIDPSGRYAACGVPADVGLLVRARSGADAGASEPADGSDAPEALAEAASGAIELELDPAAPWLERDLLVARAAADAVRGTAVLVGRIRKPDGTPIAGARVLVRAPGLEARPAVTGADGRYRLDGLPGGTHPVEAAAIGFLPARGSADLRSGETATADLVLGEAVATVEAVDVTAKGKDLSGFQKRQERGIGQFLTETELRRRHPNSLPHALSMVPGLRPGGMAPGGIPVLVGRGQCAPTVYLNGLPLPNANDLSQLVPMAEVAGVEVYGEPQDAPPQFRTRSNCTVVLVWTRGAL